MGSRIAGVHNHLELDTQRAINREGPAWARSHPSLPYTLPFIAFVVFLLLNDYLAALGQWEYPLRCAGLLIILWVCSRHVIDLRARAAALSILVGAGVFAVWIAPDFLFPGYREHWLFQNSLTGPIRTTLPDDLRSNVLVLFFRAVRAILIVPVVEELFWRAWLMRWLINPKFEQVPLGAYTASSMIVTVILFASEHGPYWEVGLAAGLIYNWWMIRTRSLGDCILAHAVTNGILSAYVIATNQWQYWM
jgi:uncharacterized protein